MLIAKASIAAFPVVLLTLILSMPGQFGFLIPF